MTFLAWERGIHSLDCGNPDFQLAGTLSAKTIPIFSRESEGNTASCPHPKLQKPKTKADGADLLGN
jgi:hypothetical protein